MAGPRVRCSPHLRRYFPDLVEVTVDATTVAGVVAALDALHPGLARYVVDERGALRRHVNVWIDDEPVRDRRALSDPVPPGATVHVLQALSGGCP